MNEQQITETALRLLNSLKEILNYAIAEHFYGRITDAQLLAIKNIAGKATEP